jgi:hypothetical protein
MHLTPAPRTELTTSLVLTCRHPAGADHTATCGGDCILACWPVDEQAFISGQLASQVHAVAKAIQAKKQKVPHHKGFQRTPAFIHAVVQKLLSGADEDDVQVEPKGGTTDVGQHTGSQARATAWPLVEQLIKVS